MEEGTNSEPPDLGIHVTLKQSRLLQFSLLLRSLSLSQLLVTISSLVLCSVAHSRKTTKKLVTNQEEVQKIIHRMKKEENDSLNDLS